MHFQASYNSSDFATPSRSYLAQRAVATNVKKGRDAAMAVTRSIAVLVTSFVLVFVTLYTFVTWPLVPKRIGYYLQQATGGDEKAAASEAPVIPLASSPTGDSDGDGFTDQQEIAAGFDPRNPSPVKLDSDSDGIKDDVERNFYGTDPFKADTDSDGHPDLEEVVNGFSPIRPSNYSEWIQARLSGDIRIPKINVVAPVVWNQDPANIEKDLDKGVVHYPGTDDPGGKSNVVITGHSSQWSWTTGKYGTVFVLLDKLEVGDNIFVDYTGTTYVYEVTERHISDPYDTQYFAASEEPRLTLMTCWPIGSSAKRLYVIAKLVGAQPITQ
jgi:LPXTG-site transpeptidase (sortase) family protein